MVSAKKTLGIIGGGNMGAAILARVRKDFLVALCEQDAVRAAALKRQYKISLLSLPELIAQSRIIILAVKPQDIDGVLEEIRPCLKSSHVIVSIAAGITTGFLEQRLPAARVIRTMPNMPAQVGEGITAVCAGRHARPGDVKAACAIFNHVGKSVVVDEPLMDAVTAVSGSGPAYVFLFVENFLNAAAQVGLSPQLSAELVRQTLAGSCRLIDEAKESPAELRAKVTSKGGTTQAALEVFAREGFERIFVEAVAAASRRAGELARR